MRLHRYVHMYRFMYSNIHACMYACMYTYISIYIYVCVYAYAYQTNHSVRHVLQVSGMTWEARKGHEGQQQQPRAQQPKACAGVEGPHTHTDSGWPFPRGSNQIASMELGPKNHNIYICIFIYMYVYMYMAAYIHMYTRGFGDLIPYWQSSWTLWEWTALPYPL